MNADQKHNLAGELEMALADLEVARTFNDAVDRFLGGMQDCVRTDGFALNRPLLEELFKAETLLNEMVYRVEGAEKRIEQTIKEAF